MKYQTNRGKAVKPILSLRERYQLYEIRKRNPDPSITYEAWVKKVAKDLNI